VRILRAVDLVTRQTYGDQNGCGRTDQDDEFPAGNGGYDADHRGRRGRRVRHPHQLHDAESQRTGKRTAPQSVYADGADKNPDDRGPDVTADDVARL
jgi:hypothetical protein